MLCVPIYKMKLAMMQRKNIFTTFSAHRKMTAEKRGQDEVFARKITNCRALWLQAIYCGLEQPSKIALKACF